MISKNTITRFLTLTFFEGVLCLIILFLIPSDPKNAWLFGVSKTRAILIAGLIAVIFTVGVINLQFFRNRGSVDAIHRTITRFLTAARFNFFVLLGLILTATVGLLLILLSSLTLDVLLQSRLVRLAPFILWISAVCIHSLIFSALIGVKPDLFEHRQHARFSNLFNRWKLENSVFRAGNATWRWWIDFPIVLLLIFLVIVVTQNIGTFVIDDAWISFKYSNNLALGNGLTWEPSSIPPVEGYSNFLEVIYIAVFLKLGVDPVLAARGLGIVATSAIILFSYALLLRLTKNRVLALAPLLPYTLHPYTSIHTWAGLETQLFIALNIILLFTLSISLINPVRQKLKVHLTILVIIAVCAALTRTEGLIVAIPTFLVGFLVNWKQNRREWFIAGTGFVFAYSLYSLFRIQYFGSLVTAPQQVKLSTQMLFGVISEEFLFYGDFFLSDFTAANLLFFLVPIALSFAYITRFEIRKNASTANEWGFFFIILMQFSGLLFVYAQSNLVQNYSARFFMQTSSQIFLLIALPAALLLKNWMLSFSKTAPLNFSAVVLPFLFIGIISLLFKSAYEIPYSNKLASSRNFIFEYNQQQSSAQAIVKTLNLHTDSLQDEWLVTIIDSGIMPYLANMKTLGGDGLTDSYLATLVPPTGPKARPYAEYIYSHNPAVMIIERVWNTEEYTYALQCDPRFSKYTPIADFTRRNNQAYQVYIRNDLTNFEEISRDFVPLQNAPGSWGLIIPGTIYESENCPFE